MHERWCCWLVVGVIDNGGVSESGGSGSGIAVPEYGGVEPREEPTS